MSRERGYHHQLGEDSADAMTSVTPSGVATRQADIVLPTVTVTGKKEVPWYETLINVGVPALTTAYAQNQMTKLNVSRINQGLAPLTAAEYAAVYQPPSAQVQVGPTAQATKLLMWAGLGVLGFIGLRAAKVI